MRRWFSRLIVCFSLLMVLQPGLAYAGSGPLVCNGTGGVQSGQLFLADAQTKEGACQYQGLNHIFSQIVCEFVLVVDTIMGKMYCGLQYAMVGTIGIVLTLYVTLFGVQMLLGTAQLNAKEAIIRLIKLSIVWTLTTKSAFAVTYIFTFFMAVMSDGSTWVVNALRDISNVYVWNEQAGKWVQTSLSQQLDQMPGGDVMPLFAFLDKLIYAAFLGPLSQANEKVIGFFTALMVGYTPMYTLIVAWLTTTFMALVRALMGFLMSIAAIAFLITLCPIFLSMMLFQSTAHFFENWLRYIISYVVQVIIVFAIIVLWVIVISKFIHFFTDLSDMIFPYQPTVMPAGAVDPKNTWGICPPVIGTDAMGAPTAACKDPNFGKGNIFKWAADMAQVVPPTKIPTLADFIYYMIYHLCALIIITHAFGTLLQHASKIAQALAGPSNVTPLMGGHGNSGFGGLGGGRSPRIAEPPAASGQVAGNFRQGMGNMLGDRT